MVSKGWLLFLASAGVGYSLYHYNVASIQTFVNNATQQVAPLLNSTVATIKQNPLLIVGIISGTATLVTAVYNKIYVTMKKRKEQALQMKNQAILESQRNITQMEQQLQTKETEIQQLKQQLQQYTSQNPAVDELQRLVVEKQKEINSLHASYQEQIKALQNMIAELKLKQKIVVK